MWCAVCLATACVLLCGPETCGWEASASSWICAVLPHLCRQIACTALNGKSGLILEWVTNNMCWCEGTIEHCFRMLKCSSFIYLHVLVVCVCVSVHIFWSEQTREGFPCGWFPNEEPRGRRPVLLLRALHLATTPKTKSHGRWFSCDQFRCIH